jgi:probable HAF family extracellular repeat protein
MKCISILVLVVCVCMTTAAWSQQAASGPHLGKGFLRHHVPKGMSSIASLQSQSSAQASPALNSRVWEFGTYPGGTWAALGGINDFGVAIGFGDIPPIGSDGVGYTHTLAVPLFGPHAHEWIDLGTLGGEPSRGWEEPYWLGISNTGLIVTHSTTPDGQVHGGAWTKDSGMVDLGTLADTGDPKYKGHNSSYAGATNKLGTLIVGWSGVNGGYDAPVVWTPSQVWNNGRTVTKWQIHALDTRGFPNHLGWQPGAVNDYGQIIAMVFDNDVTFVIPVLWNSRPDGQGWKPMVLPYHRSSEYPYVPPFGINNQGEIAGAVESADGSIWLSRLWRPLNNTRTMYTKPIELNLPTGFTGCDAVGINELGDIFGDCFNDVTDLPTRWTLNNPTFSEILNIPGDWGLAWGVNNSRIAVLTYGGGTECSAGTYGSCGGAIQLQ